MYVSNINDAHDIQLSCSRVTFDPSVGIDGKANGLLAVLLSQHTQNGTYPGSREG